MTPSTRALLDADRRLSKFDPLSRIIFYDDFDDGMNGWVGLIGNYENSLDSMLEGYRQLRQPMLSNLTHWDTGSHGSYEGTYALKIQTHPRKGAQNVALKRVTFRKPGPIQFECYFCFKPEANTMRLGHLDTRSVGILFDFQDGENSGNRRVMPHIRYLNALDGKAMGKWQIKQTPVAFSDIGHSGETRSHYHLAPTGWDDVPDGRQELCYNEVPTKINWHYLKIGFDLREMRYTAFQCNDRVYDVSTWKPLVIPAMPNLSCMLNTVAFVEADTDKRSFYYIDSVLLSGDF